MANSVSQPKVDLSAIIWIAIIGGLLSITLHELLHITLHIGQITGVHFFPNFYTAFEVTIDVPDGYDLAAEEFLAYLVSACVLLVTAATITYLYDKADTRSVQQILFPTRKLQQSPKRRSTKSSSRGRA